jgi:hypothetical protein
MKDRMVPYGISVTEHTDGTPGVTLDLSTNAHGVLYEALSLLVGELAEDYDGAVAALNGPAADPYVPERELPFEALVTKVQKSVTTALRLTSAEADALASSLLPGRPGS